MAGFDLEALAHRLVMDLAGRSGWIEQPAFFEAVLRMLARGEPIPIARLAERLGPSEAEVAAALRREAALEWDEQGRLIGWGLTLRPTPFRLTWASGRVVGAWCALDTLLFPLWLEQEAWVHASCAISGRPVSFHLKPPDALEAIDPPQTVLVVAAPQEGPDLRTAFCARTVFLAAEELLPAGGVEDPIFAVLPLPEALTFARWILGYLRGLGGIGCCPAVPIGGGL